MHQVGGVTINKQTWHNKLIQKPKVIHVNKNQKMGVFDKNGTSIGNYSLTYKTNFSTTWLEKVGIRHFSLQKL